MSLIHIDIPDNEHRKAKSYAATQGMNLKDYFIDAIKEKNDNTKRTIK